MDIRESCIEEIKEVLQGQLSSGNKWKLIWLLVKRTEGEWLRKPEGENSNFVWPKVCKICQTKTWDGTKIPELEFLLFGKPMVYRDRKNDLPLLRRIDDPWAIKLDIEEL